MPRLIWIAAAAVSALAAHADERRVVRDLEYGHALFHFYQENFFESAARLLAAREQGRVEQHRDDAELLLGGIYLSYGQQRDAHDIFERLLDERVRPEVRDRAWLYAARIAYQRGNPEGARAALARIEDELSPQFEARRRLLAAQILIEAQAFDEAAAQLDGWRAPPGWRAYAQYNHGVALVRAGQSGRGTDMLARAAREAVAGQGGRSWLRPWRWFRGPDEAPRYAEGAALRDKIYLALGFAHLRGGAAQEAEAVLARVGNAGPWASKARLGAGWAAVEAGRYGEALAHWQALDRGDPLDPAVQEARLGVPYAHARLGDEDAALAGYRVAIAAFGDEIAHLGALSQELVDERFLDTLLADDRGTEVGWFWSLDAPPADDRSRYLYALMANHRFQESLKNYRDLTALQANLQRWEEGAEAFETMLASRRARHAQMSEVAAADDRRMRLGAIGERFTSYARRLVQVAKTRDTLALATAQEARSLARIADIERTLERVAADPDFDAQRERLRLLKGTLIWRLNDQYAARLWEQRKAMKGLSAQLTDARVRSVAIAQALERQPRRFEEFAGRIEQVRPRITALRARVDASMLAHERFLKDIAIEQFDEHTRRLQAYLTEAQFALASTYDRLSLAEAGQ